MSVLYFFLSFLLFEAVKSIDNVIDTETPSLLVVFENCTSKNFKCVRDEDYVNDGEVFESLAVTYNCPDRLDWIELDLYRTNLPNNTRTLVIENCYFFKVSSFNFPRLAYSILETLIFKHIYEVSLSEVADKFLDATFSRIVMENIHYIKKIPAHTFTLAELTPRDTINAEYILRDVKIGLVEEKAFNIQYPVVDSMTIIWDNVTVNFLKKKAFGLRRHSVGYQYLNKTAIIKGCKFDTVSTMSFYFEDVPKIYFLNNTFNYASRWMINAARSFITFEGNRFVKFASAFEMIYPLWVIPQGSRLVIPDNTNLYGKKVNPIQLEWEVGTLVKNNIIEHSLFMPFVELFPGYRTNITYFLEISGNKVNCSQSSFQSIYAIGTREIVIDNLNRYLRRENKNVCIDEKCRLKEDEQTTQTIETIFDNVIIFNSSTTEKNIKNCAFSVIY